MESAVVRLQSNGASNKIPPSKYLIKVLNRYIYMQLYYGYNVNVTLGIILMSHW